MATGYLLDTTVISETRKLRADAGVTAFLAATDESGLFLSVLTLGELHKGVEIKRKTDTLSADRLAHWAGSIEANFANRILFIDTAIAQLWGRLSSGRSLPVVDTLIAATAIVHGLTLVTRNSKDIQTTGVPFIDPWQSQGRNI